MHGTRNKQEPVPAHNVAKGFGPARFSAATLLGLLLLLAVLPYANTLLGGFIYDDHEQLESNPYVYSFRHLREVFGTTSWSFQGAQGVTNYYRPMMTFGFAICFQVFGMLPFGYHLANILLHAGVVCLLYYTTRRMFGNPRVGFLTAGLFALHPIHTESVAWISGVTDLELSVFYLLTFWIFLSLGGNHTERHVLSWAAMAVSFVLAMLSKEQALTLPLLATIYEHSCREDRAETTWARKFSRYSGLWFLAAAYLLCRALFLGGLAPVLQRPGLSWREVFLSAVNFLARYVWKLLWPVRLCAFWVFHKSTQVFEPGVIAGMFVILALGGLLAWLWKRSRLASFGLFWMLITLAPVLNARWMAANAFAERYLYLPSVGFCWLVAWAWARLWDKTAHEKPLGRMALAATLGVVAALYDVRTVTRNRDWRSDIGLYKQTLEISPDAYLIRNNLGAAYWALGNFAAAEQQWREAIRQAPDHAVILTNLGQLSTRQKRYPQAIAYFERAIALKPNFAAARMHLGKAYAEMGMRDQAETQLRTAVALSPLDPAARNQLGKFYFDAGSLAEAEEQFHRSDRLIPGAEARFSLGEIYLARGDSSRAEQAFQGALALEPYDTRAHFRLGALYSASGRHKAAAREYEAGLQLDPTNPEARAALRALSQPRSAATPEP